MPIGVYDRPLQDTRFRQRVRVRGPDDCWEFQGSRDKDGYGRFDNQRAHRFAFQQHFGWLPSLVMHTCDNPPCCNWRHLKAGTNLRNQRDSIRKGRARKAHGAIHYLAKLTDSQVQRIRQLYATGRFTQQQLADRFGVHQGQVSRLVTSKRRRNTRA